MTIDELLREQCQLRPEALALIDDRARGARRSLTYAKLEREVAAAAAWMAQQGLQRGSAVLTFVPLSVDLYVALLALFRLGAVALFVDPSAEREHLERCCARWAPDALLAIPKAHLLRLRSPALRRIPRQWHTGRCWLPGTSRWAATRTSRVVKGALQGAVQPHDPALVTFTSGSTGVPKGAVRTHDFLLAQYRALAPSIHLQSGQIDLATLPVFTLANLAAGVTTVIPNTDLRRPGAVDAGALFRQIKQRNVTRLTASPALFERLVDHHQATGETLPTLTQLHTGGAPVFPRLLDAMRALAPAAQVVAVYGSTEAEPIAHIAATEIRDDDRAAMRAGRGLLAGRPVADVQLRVVRDRWGTPRGHLTYDELTGETCAPDEPGEIVVAGDHVLPGYLGGLGDEETKFKVDGRVWHRTGDAGMIDGDGRLWLLGRCAARVNDDEGVLYPFGAECVAMTFSNVRRAAALAHAGQRILVVETTATGDAARQLREDLFTATRWAKIAQVRLVPELPVDARHNAKVDYPALHRLLSEAAPT